MMVSKPLTLPQWRLLQVFWFDVFHVWLPAMFFSERLLVWFYLEKLLQVGNDPNHNHIWLFSFSLAVIDYDSKGNELSYLLVLFRLFYFTAGSPLIWRRLWLLLRFQQWLLRFCILFSPQHLHNLCKFQKNVKGLNLLNRRKWKNFQKIELAPYPEWWQADRHGQEQECRLAGEAWHE